MKSKAAFCEKNQLQGLLIRTKSVSLWHQKNLEKCIKTALNALEKCIKIAVFTLEKCITRA